MLDDRCERFLLALVPLAAPVDELEAERRDAPGGPTSMQQRPRPFLT